MDVTWYENISNIPKCDNKDIIIASSGSDEKMNNFKYSSFSSLDEVTKYLLSKSDKNDFNFFEVIPKRCLYISKKVYSV